MIGIIPVFIRIGGGLYWGFDISTSVDFLYSAYFDASYIYEIGVKYENDEWNPITTAVTNHPTITNGISFLDTSQFNSDTIFQIDISPYKKKDSNYFII